ncbi:MAG: FtsW/RodA/SpoVE family cell cycle protein [Armatimonadetes bacterium]|nr:FtsW/RodA/SpoVE family cell cycle protein [Anaerolineae bacterium]
MTHLTPARVEQLLLMLSALFIGVNGVALALARGETSPTYALVLLVWGLCALVGYAVLQRYLPIHNPLLFPLVMLLSGWGLVMIDRLAPAFADRQAIWLCAGVAGMLLAALLPQLLRWLEVYRYLNFVGGLALLVGTITFGTNPSGQAGAPQLWLGFAGLYFQPSEALKLILVAFLASYLAEQAPMLRSDALNPERAHGWRFSPRLVGPMLLMWTLAVIVLVWQRDLGAAVLFFVVFITLVYISSDNGWLLLVGAALTVLASGLAYRLFAVVRLRVDIWIDPWADADGRAYQVVQSLMAFAAGGVFGEGVGQGLPTVIPVVHSDFVLAALAEEWGLLGVTVVIMCFAVLIAQGFKVAMMQSNRPFYTLLAVGISTLLATQTLLIMGGVLKLVPLTGVTLPFMSYGGSSLLVMFVMIGLLLRLSAGKP